jgi:hypothetical protein
MKPKYLEENLSQGCSVHHEYHMGWFEIKPVIREERFGD